MDRRTELTPIQRTYLYIENYDEIKRYIDEAVSEAAQVTNADAYNISAEKAFLASIRECRTETIILFEHINKSLEALKKEATEAGEGYKYDAFEMACFKNMTSIEIAKEIGCGKNSPKKWCRAMVERLSIKLFGAKAIEEK